MNAINKASYSHVVKFRKIDDHFKDSIENKYIWFAAPETLNDPFDCRVDLREAVRRADKSNPNNQHLTNFANTYAPYKNAPYKIPHDVMIFSASMAEKNVHRSTLMWAHYGDCHKGVMIKYCTQSLLSGHLGLKFEKVQYCSNGITKWLAQSVAGNTIQGSKLLSGWWQHMFLTKTSPWQYEREVRIIRSGWQLEETHGVLIPSDPKLTIPDNAIQEMYFGFNTPQRDIDCVINLVRESFPSSNCKFFKLCKSKKTDFGTTTKLL